MNGTAVFMRFGRNFLAVTSFVMVTSCAPGSMSSKAKGVDSHVESEGSGASNISDSSIPPTLASEGVVADAAQVTGADLGPTSRLLASSDNGDLGIELVEGKAQSQLVLTSKAKAGDFSVNRLSNPDRLVIDIKGQQLSTNRNFDTSDTEFINRIRVGAHPDMARVVLDLSSGRNIEHAIESQDGKMVVSLNGTSPESPTIIEAGDRAVDLQVEPQAKLVNDEGSLTEDLKASPKLEQAETEQVNVEQNIVAQNDLAGSQAATSLENLAIEQIS